MTIIVMKHGLFWPILAAVRNVEKRGSNLLELQSSNIGWETVDNTGHVPWAVVAMLASCSKGATLGVAIMLSKSTSRVESRANVKRTTSLGT